MVSYSEVLFLPIFSHFFWVHCCTVPSAVLGLIQELRATVLVKICQWDVKILMVSYSEVLLLPIFSNFFMVHCRTFCRFGINTGT